MQHLKLGFKDFNSVLQLQKELREQRIRGEILDTLITVEHPPVITRGRRPSEGDFLVSFEELNQRGISIADAGRGGRLTYHGPGQLVGYFIFSLRQHRLSVVGFVRRVEECVIKTLRIFGLDAERREGCPGVWIQGRKIASVGFAIDRGVSMHGIALNIMPQMGDFKVIIPCGMLDCEMTSMERELSAKPNFNDVETAFVHSVQTIFFKES